MLSGGADNISLFRVVNENELNSYLEKKKQKGIPTDKAFSSYSGYEGKGAKKAPVWFSPVTSTNVGIIHQNFLTFSFNPFVTFA